jgi:SAM-dependent methyltransferase
MKKLCMVILMYRELYGKICGMVPDVRFFHFQFLATYQHDRLLRKILKAFAAKKILDVGCGNKPYSGWLSSSTSYVSLDVDASTHPDFVISPDGRWPVESATIDVVLCTQVLEHVENLELFRSEIDRILKADGLIVLSVPFLYGEHDAPRDYWRFTAAGIEKFFCGAELLECKKIGGVFSTIGLLFLNWLDACFSCDHVLVRLARFVLLPLWLIYCGFLNLLAIAFDSLGGPTSTYHNSITIFRKR